MRLVAMLGTLFVSCFAISSIALAQTELTAEQTRLFETSIRPLLIDKCLKCHGSEKQWGMLRLDSREAVLRGGETGPAIVSGKPEESLLIRAVRQSDESLSMPPKEKLTDRQIADLVRWVEIGAPFPDSREIGKSRLRDPGHWSFQPVVEHAFPQTKNIDWPNNPWDQWVLAKLEHQGMAPAQPASKRTLMRRVTFDLTGLPPSPVEISEFLADERPDAFARLIDRLLASPAYGERWGRHWLDVARYADSNGLDENVAHGNAWRYRDFVVSSFNQDQPYDQFLTEQLAGDLLSAADDDVRSRLLTATGFLALGPKVLAEVDETKMQMDIIDEQLDTFGRVFLGLTLGCARCHDHKFDPIETADYYGLAGIFKSTRTMEHFKKVAKWHENPLPLAGAKAKRSEIEAAIALKKKTVQDLVERVDQPTKPAPSNGTGSGAIEPKTADETKAELKRQREELVQLEQSLADVATAMGVQEAAVVDVAIHVRGNPLKLGDVVPRRVPKVLAGKSAPVFDAQQSGRLELARWMVDPNNPLTSRVMVNRIWRWHFGKGLVRTPDNFGLLGELPTHPELLDGLAREFIRREWSINVLHRRLLEMATYQLDSNVAAVDFERDPENRLFSRAEVQRLDAEQVRDAFLFVSDSLDRTMQGSLLTVKNRAYFFDHTSKDLTDYGSRRRSLYLPVVRNNLYDMFQLLDFPDAAVPNGDRTTTTIAPQALLMMNSDLVAKCSTDFAASLAENPEQSEAARIQAAYVRAYGRDPTTTEVEGCHDYLRAVEQAISSEGANEEDRRRRSWESLCHVMLSSNEFMYLR